jgi:hypothetical protein
MAQEADKWWRPGPFNHGAKIVFDMLGCQVHSLNMTCQEHRAAWIAGCDRQLASIYESLAAECIAMDDVDAETNEVIASLIRERAEAVAS